MSVFASLRTLYCLLGVEITPTTPPPTGKYMRISSCFSFFSILIPHCCRALVSYKSGIEELRRGLNMVTINACNLSNQPHMIINLMTEALSGLFVLLVQTSLALKVSSQLPDCSLRR